MCLVSEVTYNKLLSFTAIVMPGEMLANGNPASAESRDGEEKGHKGKQYLHAVLKSFSSSVSSFKF